MLDSCTMRWLVKRNFEIFNITYTQGLQGQIRKSIINSKVVCFFWLLAQGLLVLFFITCLELGIWAFL